MYTCIICWNGIVINLINFFFISRSSQMKFYSRGITYEKTSWAAKRRKLFALTYWPNGTDSYLRITKWLRTGENARTRRHACAHPASFEAHTLPTNLVAIMSLNQSIHYYLSYKTRTLVEHSLHACSPACQPVCHRHYYYLCSSSTHTTTTLKPEPP